ncbi:MAG: HAMP domain-containing histidine kinase [Muribaculaceae bacterium]|nr:HAMP domain-containing histidine kinase [Muribaculaceae bacterium]
MLKRLVLASALIVAFFAQSAPNLTPKDAKVFETYAPRLASVKTTLDSIDILYKIRDRVADPDVRYDVSKKIYYKAQRINRPDIQLDVLRTIASAFENNDSVLNFLLKEAESFRTSDLQLETVTQIKMIKALAEHPITKEITSPQQIVELIREIPQGHPKNNVELNDRIVKLFKLATYYGASGSGELQTSLLFNLEALINALPIPDPYIHYFFHKLSAEIHSQLGKYEKSQEANKKILKIIDSVEEDYKKVGRSYFNLATLGRFLTYRRILANYPVLDINYVDSIYNEILHLVEIDDIVKDRFNPAKRSGIFYHLAHKDYAQAVPLILENINAEDNQPYRHIFLKELVNGAKVINDQALLNRANDLYIEHLEKSLRSIEAESDKVFGILNAANQISLNNAQLEKENARIESDSLRKSRILLWVTTPLLSCFLIYIIIAFFKLRKQSRRLKQSNETLKHQRQLLTQNEQSLIRARDEAKESNTQRTEYINYIAHSLATPLDAISDYSRLIADCADEAKRPYLEKYLHLITQNNDLVHSILDNVLHLGSSDHGDIMVKKNPTAVKNLCQLAMDNARRRLKPGTTMGFADPDKEEFNINTDGSKLELCLIHLLNNAATFSSAGNITLDYKIQNGDAVFTVTDQGIGVKPENAERIFDRFVKLDKTSPGIGLGLTVCRSVITLLGGKVWCNTAYRGDGAQFILTIPLGFTED